MYLIRPLTTGKTCILNTEFFIAKRIINSKSKGRRVSRPTIRIAIAGVAIGLTVMLLTIAIVRGFQLSITDKVEGFNTDIQINNLDNNNSNEPSPISKHQHFLEAIKDLPGIKHIQMYAKKTGIIKTKTDNEGVLLNGIGSDYDWTFIKKNIVKGDVLQPSDSTPSQDIVISQKIASILDVDLGSKLLIFFITRSKKKDSYEQRVKTFNVKGIYKTGLDEFDRQDVFVDLGQIQNLNFWGKDSIGGFEIQCNSFEDIDKVEAAIDQRLSQTLQTQTVKGINSAIFSWLELQNTNAAIIIILMLVVSAIAMISALIVLILENTNMIGLLKALGARNITIQKIFLINGAYLVLRGMALGNIIGLTLCFVQKKFGLIKLPQETYYVSQVPIYLNSFYIETLNLWTFSACMLMLILPSFIISRIVPVRTLKYS
jgi:lipoprotein-releasing system permease protein